MKKLQLLWLFVVALLIATTSQAQEVKYGIKAGMNISDWKGDAVGAIDNLVDNTELLDVNPNLGFHIGTYAEIPIGDLWSLQPGIQYSQKGVKAQGRLPENVPGIFDILNPRVDITQRSHYIDVPVLLKFDSGNGFNLFAGPQISYLIDNTLEVEAGALGFDLINQNLDVNQGFRKVDAAISAGLGYEFSTGFNVSASYDFGLTSLDENNRFDAYNRVAKVSVGYTF